MQPPRLTTRLFTAGLAAATALTGVVLVAPQAHAAAATTFTPGELVVDRVGTGSAALSSSATPTFLDEYPATGASAAPDLTVALPTAVSGGNQPLTNSGSATSEGALSLSPDGRYLALGGYAAAPGVASVASTTASSVNRVVGLVDGSGTVDTSTHVAAYSGNNIRGAVTSDGTTIWTTGSGTSTDGGVRTTTRAATTSSTVNDQSQAGASNMRTVQIVGGQLYISNGSNNVGVARVGSGTPTSANNTLTSIAPIISAYGFVLLDEDPNVAGVDTLYAGDQSSTASLYKYTLGSNGSWTSRGSVAVAAGSQSGLTGLTGTYANGVATLYGTVGASAGNALATFTDTAAQTAAPTISTPKVLATAAANTVFRGLAFAPTPAKAAQTAPTITTQPADRTIDNSRTATLSVTATGTPAPTYQWYVGTSGDTGTPVSGATSASYTTPALTQTTQYWVRVTNAAGSVDSRTVTVTVNPPANTSPTISTPTPLSGAQGDPTDPTTSVTVGDAETPAGSLTVAATASSSSSVAATSDVTVTGSGATRTIAVSPEGRGYADITLTVTDGGGLTATSTLHYASSGPSPSTTRWITGASDSSTEVAVGNGYDLVGDDEDQQLRLYDTTHSGAPVASFDYTSMLGLTDTSGGVPKEVDIEASTRVGNTIYWFGSESNSSSFNTKPNRDRVFATTVSGSGASTTLSFAGYYSFLREDLIAWDQANGNRFGLAASAASGVDPKQADGYDIEGVEMAPAAGGGLSTTTAYIGFRAPLEPTSSRTQALLVPLTDLPSLISGTGGTQGSATFGPAILQSLGGNGIREIRANADGQYLEIAGPPGSGGPSTEGLYTWDGQPADAPVLRSANLTGPGSVGPYEGVVAVPDPLTSTSTLGLVADSGSVDLYGDGTEAKDLTTVPFEKSRIDQVQLGAVVTAASTTTVLDPSPTPAAGQGASATVTVDSADTSRTPTGTIDVTDLGDGSGAPVDLGTATLAGDGTPGEATATVTATFARGTHQLQATYTPDSASLVTGSSGTAPAFTVVPSTTTGAPTYSPARPTVNQDVLVSVAVSASDGSDPAGTVQLVDGDGNDIGGPAPVDDGTATVAVTAGTVPVGDTELHGIFTGSTAADGLADAGSTGPSSTLSVVAAGTTTSAPSFDPAQPTYGQDVTVTVTVTATDGTDPAGTVQLIADDGTAIGGPVVVSDGQAQVDEPAGTFPLGDTGVHGLFTGGTGYADSTGPSATVTVTQVATTVGAPTFDPAQPQYGQDVTVTVPVGDADGTDPSGTDLSGSVQLVDGQGNDIGSPIAVSGGQAQADEPAGTFPLGDTAVHGVFTPDGPGYAGSQGAAATVTVVPAATTTTVTTPGARETVGTPVTVTVGSAAGTPGGSITLTDVSGAQPRTLCTVALSGGSATVPSSCLPPGDYRLQATYRGDDASGDYAGSTSAVTAYTVVQADGHLTIKPHPKKTSPAKQTRVSGGLKRAAGLPAPTGTVAFSYSTQDGSRSGALCTLPVKGGGTTKTCSLASLAPGTYLITGRYSGDTDYAAETTTLAVTVR